MPFYRSCVFVFLFLLSGILNSQNLTNGLIAHYPLDGNANDIGPNSLNGTLYNATATSNWNGNPNAATYFDGINNYMALPNNILLKPQLPLTISFKIKLDAFISNTLLFGTDNYIGLYKGVWLNITQNKLIVSYGDGNGNNVANRRSKTGTTTLNINQWYDVALVIKGPNDIDIFIDGINDGGSLSGSGGNLSYSNVNGDLGRGASIHASPGNYIYYKGYLDEFIIWDRALTTTEVSLLSSNDLIAHYPLNGNANDIGPFNLDGTFYNATATSDCKGQINSATYFDGVNDYIALPNNPLFKPLFPLSIKFQIKLENYPSNFYPFFINDNNPNLYSGIFLNINNSGNVIAGWGDSKGNCQSTFRKNKIAGAPLPLNEWVTVTIIMNNNNDIDIYYNCIDVGGILVGNGSVNLAYSSGDVLLGRRSDCVPTNPPFNYFKGYLDEFQIWNKALNISEITSSCDCNKLIAHYPLDGNADDIGPNNLDGTSYNATAVTDCAESLNSATYFDGINDYITLPSDPLLQPLLPVSFSYKIKIDSYSGFKFFFSNDNVQGNYYGIWLNVTQGGYLAVNYGDGGNEDISNRRTAVSNTKLKLNQWYQITTVIKGPMDMDIYINCKKDLVSYEGSGFSLQYSSSSTDAYFGRSVFKISPYSYFNGYLDEFKIWNDTLTSLEIEMLNKPCGSDSITLSICDGDSATINNIDFYKNSGVYIDTLYGATWSGCDSVITLTLNVNPVYTQTLSTTICEGDTFFHGNNFYTLAGTYVENHNTIKGCDSTITVNLNVNPTFDQSIVASLCDGDTFFLGNQNLTTTGIFTENMLTTEGCDSTVTVDLTVNPTYNSTITATICDGDTFFHGNNYYTITGFFTETYSTVNSCDSIINIDLTVDPVYDQIVSASICEGDTFFHGSNFYTLTGTYVENHNTIEGCDSTITVNLNVDPTFDQNISASICDGDTFFLGTQNLTTTGIFTENLLTIEGCDSTVTVDLTVNPTYNSTITANICDGDTFFHGNNHYTTTGFYTETYSTVNLCDSIINIDLTVDPVYDQIVAASICEGDTFFHGSNFYTLTGTYVENHITGEGCDSTITVNLNVDPTFDQSITASICDGDTFFLGTQNLTTTGIFTENLLTIEGCDSSVTVDLTVNPTYNSTITANICDGDTFFHGNNHYTTTGFYTETYSTVNLCDSIINIDLTVDPVYDQIVAASICEGDTFFHGSNFYTLTGTYVENHITGEGCDSTITVNLNVDPTFDQSITASMCDGDTFFLGTQNLTTTGIFTEDMLTIEGCDSSVTVDLTVNPAFNSTITANICDGDTFFHGNNHYTTTGFYTETYSTVNLCDSIINIDLTVDPVYDQIVAASICEGDTFFHGSNFYTLTGTYVENHTTMKGCDSTITVDLNVNPTFDQNISASICDGDTFFLGTQNLTTTGIFTEDMLTIEGCDSSVTVDLIVNPSYSIDVDASVCEGDTFYIGNNKYFSSGNFILNYSTSSNCDSILNLNLTIEPYTYDTINIVLCKGDLFDFNGSNITEEGIYLDTLFIAGSCPIIEVLYLKTIVPIEFAIIGDTIICEGQSAQLSTTPSFQVRWSTNDSLYEIEVVNEGIYWAQLQTTCGLVDDSINVHIEDCNTQIEVPNVFTPNGDGINDVFYIKADHLNNYSINIFNRWNQLMFSSNTLDYVWDGRSNGKEAEAGVYFYIIHYQDHSGKNKSLQGTITLIR